MERTWVLVVVSGLMLGAWGLLGVTLLAGSVANTSTWPPSPPADELPPIPEATIVGEFDGAPSGFYRMVFYDADETSDPVALLASVGPALVADGWAIDTSDSVAVATRGPLRATFGPRSEWSSIQYDVQVTITYTSMEAGNAYWSRRQEGDDRWRLVVLVAALCVTALWGKVAWSWTARQP